jgi:hypothetical protein
MGTINPAVGFFVDDPICTPGVGEAERAGKGYHGDFRRGARVMRVKVVVESPLPPQRLVHTATTSARVSWALTT